MALSMTTSLCNSEPCEAYEFLIGCQTLDQLALIRENDNAMRMHALLVNERLLLKSGEINHLVSLIIKQSNFYKWRGIFHRCLQLRLHAYRLVIQMKRDDWHDYKWHIKYLDGLVKLLFNILQQEGTVLSSPWHSFGHGYSRE
jgi:hypothetical protein